MAANKGVVASVSKFLQFGGEHAAFLGLFGAGLAALVSGSVYVANLKSQVAMNQLRNEKELAVVKSQMETEVSNVRAEYASKLLDLGYHGDYEAYRKTLQHARPPAPAASQQPSPGGNGSDGKSGKDAGLGNKGAEV